MRGGYPAFRANEVKPARERGDQGPKAEPSRLPSSYNQAMFPEEFSEGWRARFGEASPETIPALAGLLAHRSVRDYADRPVEESTVRALIGVAQSASTSSNLQLWSAISVQEPERREQMARLCADQRQVRSCPWFLAFVADHRRLRLAAEAVGEGAEGLDYTEYFLMALIDAALAAERLVCAAETLGLGVCYIGALRNDPEGVRALLGLPEGVFGAFGLCLGWPAEPLTAEIKPRLPQEAVWFRERYPEHIDLSDYEARMRAFYESQGMRGDATWSKRSGKRVDNHHLTGREVLKAWLEAQGFNRR